MLCRDLIKKLEELIERNKPYEEYMGEAEIMIDVFGECGDKWVYRGIDPDVRITPSEDGVYNILTAFVKEIK